MIIITKRTQYYFFISNYGYVAQRLEHGSYKPGVGGPNPPVPTKSKYKILNGHVAHPPASQARLCGQARLPCLALTGRVIKP